MKRIVVPPRAYIILGLTCFIIGLVIILPGNYLFSSVAQIVQNAESELIVGAVITSIGQAITVFGAVKANSNKLVSNLKWESQVTMANYARNMEQLQLKMQNEHQTLMSNYIQTMSKLDNLLSNQKELNNAPQAVLPISCKFCGTKTEQNRFCPNCGKAN